MKAFWLICLAGCGLGLLLYFAVGFQVSFTRPVPPSTSGGISNSSVGPPHSGPANQNISTVEAKQVPIASPVQPLSPEVSVAADKGATNLAASRDDATLPATASLEQVRRLVLQYNSMFGENPVGTNEEITRALRGENPKQIDFLGTAMRSVSPNGELMDPWGTPYFFHQLSGKEMEIRSAGPDKVMWTRDDVITR